MDRLIRETQETDFLDENREGTNDQILYKLVTKETTVTP